MTLDSLNHTWNRVVITYDFERQAEAAIGAGRHLQQLRKIEIGNIRSSAIPYLLLLVLATGGCSIFIFRRRIFVSREERLLRRFYRRVKLDCTVEVKRGRVGLFELAEITGNHSIRKFADIYAGRFIGIEA